MNLASAEERETDENLATFLRVFHFQKSRINENSDNRALVVNRTP